MESVKSNARLVSSHGEFSLPRHATFEDVVEGISSFFEFEPIIITAPESTPVMDRLDLVEIDRESTTLVLEYPEKSQWVFQDAKGIRYTVFSGDAADYLSNPSLEQLKISPDLIDPNTAESSESEEEGIAVPVKSGNDLSSSDDIFSDEWSSESSFESDRVINTKKSSLQPPPNIIDFKS